MEYLYQHKKVRPIGVSNAMQHHLEDLLQDAKIISIVNQMEFDPFLVHQGLRISAPKTNSIRSLVPHDAR
ncbi:hypothetical protein [uncultured Croceitalea sp.]|uniref:hypothetical protein n=1 Tax=uncultured Croceitalea sp. TaxID=1798908 RepID=UPI0033059571